MGGTEPPNDWAEIASLVDVLLDAAPEQRPALVAELSGNDATRRAALERLLADCERESPLLDRPATERFASLFADDVARFPAALAERYRLTNELGRGGMASVFLARDLKHGRDVAVKVVHPMVASVLGAERFLREIRIMAQLRHPHIVPLFDSGDADGALYYVMPYEPGPSLRQRVAQDGQLPLDDVVLILRDVCDALAYAHQSGVVHRDIKPDNVLLAGRRALVTDFGVARAASEAASEAGERSSVSLGTPAYMAPEQIVGDANVDHRADIYSTGVLAYELLAGRLPFAGETHQEMLSAHLNDVPAPVSAYRADVPAALEELVMRCLEKKKEARWQSADEMVQRLEALSSDSTRPTRRELARSRARRGAAITIGVLGVAVLIGVALRSRRGAADAWRDRWARAHVERLTDFPGSEVDAAISPNGQLVAFLADRDSIFDAFAMPVGSDRVTNLTEGRFPEMFNDDVRNVGFSGDAAQVWLRRADLGSPVRVVLLPTTGGAARPFLDTAVTVAWSPDGKQIAYHEGTLGDPMHVADADGRNARRIHVAAPGVHSHHPAWSPDGRLVYFTQGLPPDEMDVWRIASDGSGVAEQITHHRSRVAYPALLDERTLVYSATADDGTGPFLYLMDLEERVAHRVSTAVEHYLSVAAAAAVAGQPRRLVATVSNPAVQLWSVPIADSVTSERGVSRVELPTARGAAPRFAADSSLLYLASRGGADGLWRLANGRASELWKPAQGAVVGAAAVSPDGGRVCFPVRRQSRTTLHCTAADGSGARAVAESLDVRGAASWSPDGRWLTVAARDGAGVKVFKVPVDGGAPVRLVDSVSTNPVWSPDGAFILYSGTPRARSVPVKAVTPDGKPHTLPALSVDRVGDSYRFLPNGRGLVVKLGGFRRQDFWSFDLATGERRRLTALRPGESLSRFDVSPDGKRILFERVRENSDVVLIELPAR